MTIESGVFLTHTDGIKPQIVAEPSTPEIYGFPDVYSDFAGVLDRYGSIRSRADMNFLPLDKTAYSNDLTMLCQLMDRGDHKNLTARGITGDAYWRSLQTTSAYTALGELQQLRLELHDRAHSRGDERFDFKSFPGTTQTIIASILSANPRLLHRPLFEGLITHEFANLNEVRVLQSYGVETTSALFCLIFLAKLDYDLRRLLFLPTIELMGRYASDIPVQFNAIDQNEIKEIKKRVLSKLVIGDEQEPGTEFYQGYRDSLGETQHVLAKMYSPSNEKEALYLARMYAFMGTAAYKIPATELKRRLAEPLANADLSGAREALKMLILEFPMLYHPLFWESAGITADEVDAHQEKIRIAEEEGEMVVMERRRRDATQKKVADSQRSKQWSEARRQDNEKQKANDQNPTLLPFLKPYFGTTFTHRLNGSLRILGPSEEKPGYCGIVYSDRSEMTTFRTTYRTYGGLLRMIVEEGWLPEKQFLSCFM